MSCHSEGDASKKRLCQTRGTSRSGATTAGQGSISRPALIQPTTITTATGTTGRTRRRGQIPGRVIPGTTVTAITTGRGIRTRRTRDARRAPGATGTDRTTATRVTGGRVESFTSWSATGSTVAGLTAEEDARLRLMRILADDIVARLLATSGDWLK